MVNHTKQMVLVVSDQYRMYLIFVHNSLYLSDLGLRLHCLGRTRHDVADSVVEELCLPFLRDGYRHQ